MRLLDRLRAPATPTEERAAVRLFESWRGLQPKEKLEDDFRSYVSDGYKANAVVFAVILSRLSLFSDVRFQFRNKKTFDLFGTADLEILEQPWQNGTTGELLARMEQDVSLAGNAYLLRATPTMLQRLRPDWVQIVSTGSELFGYLYTPGGPGGDDATMLFPDNVAHWSPIPDPMKNYAGMSWLTPVVHEVMADSLMTRHKEKFFSNAATPNLLIKYQDKLDNESRERIKAQLELRYEGAENAYKTMVLEDGADAQVIGANMQAMSFDALQAAGENRIAAAGGVPGIIVGLKEGLQAATYSNYAQAFRRFVDMWAYPQWRSVCAALDSLVDTPNSGSELWFDTSQIQALRQNEKDKADIELVRAQMVVEYVRAGYDAAATLKFAATYQGLESLPHTGDVYFPGNPNQTPIVEPAPDGTAAPKKAIVKPVPVALPAPTNGAKP